MIHLSFIHGKNFKIGSFCVIEEDVEVGDDVTLGNWVLLKSGTRVGNRTFLDSFVSSSGDNRVGDDCQIRYRSTLARNLLVENNVFFSAGVKTIYLDPGRGGKFGPISIGDNCFLGDNVVVMHGIVIAHDCIIGACSLVTKSTEPHNVYYGSPAKFRRPVYAGELYELHNGR